VQSDNGVRYPFTGNVHDSEGSSTYCHHCDALLIERNWYRLGRWGLIANGSCQQCDTPLPGQFGSTRMPVRLTQ